MTRRGKPNGLTLAETLFLVLVCMFALAILMPMLARRRSTSPRMTCGGKLCSVGKAMLIYANDYGDEFPRAGGPDSRWTGRILDWAASTRHDAYGLASDGAGGQVSVSASLYLLVKYEGALPELFLCIARGAMEKGMSTFEPATYGVRDKEETDLWDFGPNPSLHCSYSYQMVYGPHKLSTSCKPGIAVAADRNPWMDSPSAKAKDFSLFTPDMAPFGGSVEQGRYGNALPHDEDGQQVLFVDAHVEFAKRPWCSFENDNIYTSWDGSDKIRGKPPKVGSMPAGPTDSLLVNDPIRP